MAVDPCTYGVHTYQHHPQSDDFGVCMACGHEEGSCEDCGRTLIGPHEGDKWCPECNGAASPNKHLDTEDR